MKNSPSARSDLLFCLLTIVPFFLAAEAKVYDGMTGLSLGIYSALVFCRCNYFLISPMFLAGTALSDAGLQNILYCAAPILLFGVAKAIHFAAARPMGVFAANVYAMIGQLPSFLFVSDAFPLRLAVASVAANQLLCYCATVIGYALIVRGVRNRLSADEVVGGAVVAIVLSLGLFRADVFGFSPYFALLGWLILASLHSFSTPAGLLIAFCMGMGGAVASLDFAVCGAAVAMFVVACAFRKLPCFFRFAAIMVADFLAGTLLGAYPYTLTHIISLAAGGVCFVALPKKVRSRLAVYIPEDRAASAKRILAHGRGEVFARLTGVAKVFFEMGKSFAVPDDRSETSLPAPQQIAQDVMLRVCARCPSRESCQRALGSDTSALFVSAASTALSGGGAAPADLPPFVISRCDRTDVLVNECNNAAARLVKRRVFLLRHRTIEVIGAPFSVARREKRFCHIYRLSGDYRSRRVIKVQLPRHRFFYRFRHGGRGERSRGNYRIILDFGNLFADNGYHIRLFQQSFDRFGKERSVDCERSARRHFGFRGSFHGNGIQKAQLGFQFPVRGSGIAAFQRIGTHEFRKSTALMYGGGNFGTHFIQLHGKPLFCQCVRRFGSCKSAAYYLDFHFSEPSAGAAFSAPLFLFPAKTMSLYGTLTPQLSFVQTK